MHLRIFKSGIQQWSTQPVTNFFIDTLSIAGGQNWVSQLLAFESRPKVKYVELHLHNFKARPHSFIP